jgi:hypothetical protein
LYAATEIIEREWHNAMTTEGCWLANQAQTTKEMAFAYKNRQKHKWYLHFIEFPV